MRFVASGDSPNHTTGLAKTSPRSPGMSVIVRNRAGLDQLTGHEYSESGLGQQILACAIWPTRFQTYFGLSTFESHTLPTFNFVLSTKVSKPLSTINTTKNQPFQFPTFYFPPSTINTIKYQPFQFPTFYLPPSTINTTQNQPFQFPTFYFQISTFKYTLHILYQQESLWSSAGKVRVGIPTLPDSLASLPALATNGTYLTITWETGKSPPKPTFFCRHGAESTPTNYNFLSPGSGE